MTLIEMMREARANRGARYRIVENTRWHHAVRDRARVSGDAWGALYWALRGELLCQVRISHAAQRARRCPG